MDTNPDLTPEMIIKASVGLPILYAVDSVVSKTLLAVVPAPAKLPTKIVFAVGRYVISSVVAGTITDTFVDTNYRLINNIVTGVKAAFHDESEEDESK